MRHLAHRLLLLLLLLATAQGAVSQVVTYTLVNHDTLRVSNCHGDNVRLEFPYSTVRDSIDMHFVLETNGTPFSISVSMNQYISGSASRATLKLWNGDSATGTVLLDTSATNIGQLIQVSSGRLTGRLQRPDTTSFSLSVSIAWYANQTFNSTCQYDVDSLRVTSLTHNTAMLRWASGANSCRISYGGITQTIMGHEAYLQNLAPDSVYTVTVLPLADASRPCCARTITFRTNCTPYTGCPNFTDFQSGSVRAYRGTTSRPYDTIGFVDFGSNDYWFSRHTVHTDTTETDPYTGDLLRTVYPGLRSSVRLGNRNIHSEAEALEYFLYIDTSFYAFLLLHYAVVLQNPGHAPSAQPRFRMEVLDGDGQVIDPVCGVADFRASGDLGWNEDSYEENVWKDWTTVGFDMTPYHGQIVKVRFTTYDCSAGLHYGYAYFCAECSLNSASTEYCGATDTNTLTAPDGFNYLWYYNNPADTISTAQTVTFGNSDAMLHCRLISKENPVCYVTLNTYAGHRWPQADGAIFDELSLGCDGYQIQFVNNSVVTNNDGDTVDLHCETARWYFGDAYMSYEYNPHHIYRDSGDYTITLVAGIANNSCRDTFQFPVHIPDFYVPALKDTFACDTMWFDGVDYTLEGLGPSYRVHHPGGCDTMYTLNIHLLHSPVTVLPVDTFCYRDTYIWHELAAGDPHITDTAHWRLVGHEPAANGCDSILVLNLVQLPPAHLSVYSKADCSNKKYHVTVTSEFPYLHWSSDPYDTCITGHETDSSILVIPATPTVYTVTTDYRDTTYCPTSYSFTLAPADFPKAAIEVLPQILTYEQPEFDAYDISRLYPSRWWGLQIFPGDGDTVLLYETSPHLHYRLEDYDIDSVKVILSVSNEACHDTTHLTLPLIKVAIWAANVFTPSEYTNNRFTPITTGILESELFIYDRAGRQIFNTRDLQQGWDGTHGGVSCPQGAYVWLLRYRAEDFPDTWQTATGSVTLLR
ncbi:MAG: gliding motility-associated C-terminal domain-containing protein [Bacteroidales bacterium]|nr:gliding motility-associated C-terminal domain-containing protein [Bacteroidales bacterium]